MHHPWTRERSSSPTTCATRWRSPSCGEHYGISRKIGYKWIERYLRQAPAGLEERSRRPRRSPKQTAEEIVTAILDARRRHPSWSGKKLLALLHKGHPWWRLPGRSTACDILSRHGLVPTMAKSLKVDLEAVQVRGPDEFCERLLRDG
jgi:transposase